MEKSPLKIYVDRLKGDHTETIDEEISSNILDVDEPDLRFAPLIAIKGKAYLADDHLVMQLDLSLSVTLPCSICNEAVILPLNVKQLYITTPIEAIKGHIFNYTSEVREGILLNTPALIECHGGHCPKRSDLKKYLSHSHVQYPFSDIE